MEVILLNLITNLQLLYHQAESLQFSRADYAKVLEQQRNIELLNKALNAGQLSVIDYFTELSTIYDSHQSYLDVEKEYHSILANCINTSYKKLPPKCFRHIGGSY